MRSIGHGVILLATFTTAVATCAQAAATLTADGTVEIRTPSGPVKGKVVIPESSKQKPEDAGKRANTPLRAVVPEQPVEPPRSPALGPGK